MESDLKAPLLPQKTPSDFSPPPTSPESSPDTYSALPDSPTPVPPTHPTVPTPKPKPELRVINCARCRVLLQYQAGSYSVGCPFCRTQTAVQALTQFSCPRCRQVLTCPTGTKLAACPCGQLSALVSS